jgi:hemerythrin-like domain-containing protein
MNTTRQTIPVPLPGHRAPASGFEAPFEMLAACHERVERMLGLLQRLREHLRTHGRDADASAAARDVMRYFDQAAPLHHQDEELHVFPLTLASGSEHIKALTEKLMRDHREMETLWPKLRTLLLAVADATVPWQPWGQDADALLDSFVRLYEQHLRDEDGVIYPDASTRMPQEALQAMSQDMMGRRGVKP